MLKEPQQKQHYDKIFAEEFYPLVDYLASFAYNFTNNDADVQDLVQETYMKAYRFIDSYKEGSNAKAWLLKILQNNFINHYRKRKRQPSRIDFEEVLQYQNQEDGTQANAYVDLREELFQSLIGDEVSRAINSLSIDHRMVILLCDIEGFSYEEISKIVDIPLNTVRTRLFRARNLLKAQLKTFAEERGYTDNRK